MDPNANIARQRKLAAELIERIDAEDADFNIEAKAVELAELVQALDEWRFKGGFDPYHDDTGKLQRTLPVP